MQLFLSLVRHRRCLSLSSSKPNGYRQSILPRRLWTSRSQSLRSLRAITETYFYNMADVSAPNERPTTVKLKSNMCKEKNLFFLGFADLPSQSFLAPFCCACAETAAALHSLRRAARFTFTLCGAARCTVDVQIYVTPWFQTDWVRWPYLFWQIYHNSLYLSVAPAAGCEEHICVFPCMCM